MRALFDISDPADVHLFKNAIHELEKKGNKVRVTAREKEVNAALLHHEGIPFISRGQGSFRLFGKGIHLVKNDLFLINQAMDFKPDIIIGSHNPYVAHTGKLLKIPSLIFSDSEHARLQNLLMYPFATHICIPDCYYYPIRWGTVHRYPGYHALAYLHPDYFTPDDSILRRAGLAPDEPFILVRFIAWTANHDHGHSGIPEKITLITELARHVRVIISSESALPEELRSYHLPVDPWNLHDLLSYATLYIGEGATIASEAAVLGTHALYVNTMKVGYTIEQEEKYHLVWNFHERQTDCSKILTKAIELLNEPDLKEKGVQKRMDLIAENTDVSRYIISLIEKIADPGMLKPNLCM